MKEERVAKKTLYGVRIGQTIGVDQSSSIPFICTDLDFADNEVVIIAQCELNFGDVRIEPGIQ